MNQNKDTKSDDVTMNTHTSGDDSETNSLVTQNDVIIPLTNVSAFTNDNNPSSPEGNY
eukprot:CAMPEP_0114665850 /NCGR_PEP_ID=MMETSP0191-20121206/31547_1 /TAXON_ID=126664 /ORGANISM="Sorites sp." /LENGTH=57 /DNA_ID=CAMNT_0001912059 /DNA_START=317 /DNA_END=490 /DNA_ORIENTATION=+